MKNLPKKILFLVILGSFILVILWSCSRSETITIIGGAPIETVFVQDVLSGNSILLADGRTIVYADVGIPRFDDPFFDFSCIAKRAKDYNTSLVKGKMVRLVPNGLGQGENGALIRYVFLKDSGKLVNQSLISVGLGHFVEMTYGTEYSDRMKKAEETAKKQQYGMWAKEPCEKKL